MTACRVLRSRLTYFWKYMNISSIFYFSKSTSKNTQYSSLWDSLEMMLFTKYLIKWKRIGRISWKFSVLVWFTILYRTRYEKIDVRLVQCPFKHLIKNHQLAYWNHFEFHNFLQDVCSRTIVFQKKCWKFGRWHAQFWFLNKEWDMDHWETLPRKRSLFTPTSWRNTDTLFHVRVHERENLGTVHKHL